MIIISDDLGGILPIIYILFLLRPIENYLVLPYFVGVHVKIS